MAAPDPRVAFLTRQRFAHRGLHGGGIEENSLAAFDAAVAAGLGMECDVRLSQDGVPFVFHDERLDRLTGEPGPLAERSAAELRTIRLLRGGETLLTLEALLGHLRGAQPLLIEVKAKDRKVGPICRAVLAALQGYEGDVAVMSFNPRVSAWFRRAAPHLVRGLVVSEQGKGRWRGAAERSLALRAARPDFLAYDVRDLPSPFAARVRARGLPMLSWTVDSAEREAAALEHVDQLIFEAPRHG